MISVRDGNITREDSSGKLIPIGHGKSILEDKPISLRLLTTLLIGWMPIEVKERDNRQVLHVTFGWGSLKEGEV